MSHRRLSGWEPAEVTTFEYDGDRLVRQVTVREPEFDVAERSLLLAVRRVVADRGPHGFPMSEATDPANQFAFEGYVITDYVEAAKATARERLYDQYPKASRAGHLWGVRRRGE